MKTYEKDLREVERTLASLKREIPEGFSENYIGGGGSKLRYLGLRVPTIRAVYKKGFKFSEEKDVHKIWDYIFLNSEVYETISLAMTWFDDKRRVDQRHEHWPLFSRWVDRIDNWAHSDTLSGLIASVVESHPKLALPVLEKWSNDKNPWMRRNSIVGLLYYARFRKKLLPFATLKKFVAKQIDVDHHYVQRGVGWTLREMHNVYPQETLSYLEEVVTKLSAIAYAAAAEKLPEKTKLTLKKKRAAARKKND